MICSNCGCFITENNRKCWNCGTEGYEFSDQLKQQREKPIESKPISRKIKMLLFGFLMIITMLDLYLIMKVNAPVSEIQDKKIVQEDKEKQTINYELMNNIKSKHQLQNVYLNNKQKLVIYIRNSSDKYFSGNLSLTVYDQNGQIVNNSFLDDMTYTNVSPNAEPYQTIWVDRSKKVTVADVHWSNIKFTDNPTLE